jgi:hypothetical protein
MHQTPRVALRQIGSGFRRGRSRLPVAACVIAAVGLLSGCGSDAPNIPTEPPVGDGANMQLVRVQFTQGVQDAAGSISLVAGMATAVNVQISRSKESQTAVPVVLRLFRGGALIRIDTARTTGTLGLTTSATVPSAQFLIPAVAVSGALSYQVEIDPGRTVGDSSRLDNLLPGATPGALNVVALQPISVRFVPVILSSHDNATGSISSGSTERFVQTIRQTMPVGALVTAIGSALTSSANFGTPPTGAAPAFWTSVLQELDIARVSSPQRAAYWYGVVGAPSGYTRYTNGGYGYIPNGANETGSGTRTAVGFGVSSSNSAAFASKTLAHELGHMLGRLHAPSCSAGSPLDATFPDAQGTILLPGFDVWSWASGATTGAPSIAASTGDVMGYCAAVWSSPHTWNGILRWRQQSQPIVAQVRPEPAVLIAGSVAANGTVTLRPALDGEAIVPAPDAAGDMVVELQADGGAVMARTQVQSARVDHADGERHFLAVLPRPTSQLAAAVVATSRDGQSAMLRAVPGDVSVQVRTLAGLQTEVRTQPGRAILLRDATTGEVLSIGWNGRAVVPTRGAITASVSNGVRSRTEMILPR